VSIFNPIKGIIETKESPHSRAYRTTFWGKMKDTFIAFSGNIIPNNRPGNPSPFKNVHLGVFDYLTLGTHFILSELLMYLIKKSRNISPIAVGLLVLTFIFNIPRLLFAGVMTLVCVPFIAIAQAVSKEQGTKVKEEILSYPVHDDEVTLYLAASGLPSRPNRLPYKNSFFWDMRKLYYIDCRGESEQLTLSDDISNFKKSIDNHQSIPVKERFVYPSLSIKREDLEKYVENMPLSLSNLSANVSLRKILQFNNIDLEDVGHSAIEMDQSNEKVIKLSLKSDRERPLTKFSLNLNEGADLSLFKKVRELNIGGVQKLIEEDPALFKKFSS
jgi:hypothetical protein